jgi:hypothetical protein
MTHEHYMERRICEFIDYFGGYRIRAKCGSKPCIYEISKISEYVSQGTSVEMAPVIKGMPKPTVATKTELQKHRPKRLK